MAELITQPIKVLIVDDHPLLRDGVGACLREDSGIALVGQAGNAQEALQEAERLRPDLILMDISLGEMDGIEATRRICAALPQTRVLILTMHDKPHYVAQGLAAGARGYVLKGAGGAELLCGIRAVHQGGLYFSKGVDYPPKLAAPDTLTRREIEVLCFIAQGLSAKKIALTLGIGDRTVECHLRNIYGKLDIHNAVELTRWAIAHGVCAGR
ncbi:MAG TPA: response regulator transcription factor [Lamprocystis sp. (in: g-proteobacteria)]|nr:response regulator transcription factor [Lamprocystis sp. (in: g-proteobacteria)]